MTGNFDPSDNLDPIIRRLARRRRLARAVLLFERVWPAIWPAAGAAGALLCAILLDLPALLPPALHLTVIVLGTALVLTLLARGLWRITRPTALETDRRLETASGLNHRPLAVLTDRPAGQPTPESAALWQAHIARAAARIARLRVGAPRPGLAARDPRAFRGLLVVALAACLVIAGPDGPGRILRAMQPGFAPPPPASVTQIQAWITPPAYTGQAPLFLKPETPTVTVPAGAHLTVSVTGGDTAAAPPALTLAGTSTGFQTLDNASFQSDQDLATGGRLTITRAGRNLGAWDIAVVPDRAPEVSFSERPGATRGRTQQARLPWQVSHDYGVVSLTAELHLKDRPEAPPLVLAIPLPGGSPKTAKGVRLQDLTANPWAGLPVIAQLQARDAPGLVGHSANAGFILPERHFDNPVAQALMALRRGLSLKPGERVPAITGIDQLAGLEDIWARDLPAYLNLRAIGSLLYRDPAPEAVDDAQQRMWQLALHMEEGAPERTARALDQARQALREALEAEKRGEPVDKAELDRKMQEIQKALEQHLQALAEQAARDPDQQQTDAETRRLDAQDMQKLAEQMRKDAQSNKMDQARDKMAELEKMLDALQNGRPEHGKMTEQDRKRAEKRQQGQQQMTALQDIVRREGTLLDHAQSRADAAREARDPRRAFPRRPDSIPDPKTDTARAGEQRTQQALRRALGELMQRYGDLTGEIPPNLGEADTAMRDAAQNLASANQDASAADAELRAIEALQKGGRAMSQQMANQFGRGQGEDEGEGQDMAGDQPGDQPGDGMGNQPGGNQPGGRQFGNRNGRGDRMGPRSVDRRADERRDPLGRPLKEGTSGMEESGDVQVPDQMEEARGRVIQEELRRRGADRTRPQPELDYIGRLLQQF